MWNLKRCEKSASKFRRLLGKIPRTIDAIGPVNVRATLPLVLPELLERVACHLRTCDALQLNHGRLELGKLAPGHRTRQHATQHAHGLALYVLTRALQGLLCGCLEEDLGVSCGRCGTVSGNQLHGMFWGYGVLPWCMQT